MFKTKPKDRFANWQLNRPPFKSSFAYEKGEVGIELEMEGDNLPSGISAGKKMPARWNTVADGSLRASDGRSQGGREYVLAEPIERQDVEQMVRHIFRVLDETGSNVILSNRTSTHIHINISNLLINQIISYIIFWNIFEEAIVNSCGETRVGNLFCLRTKDCSRAIEALQQGIQQGLSFVIGENHKYLSCNYYAMPHYGSLEFRCWPGADNADQVISWVKFLLALKDYAITNHANPEFIGMAISENSPSQIFERICQDSDNMTFFNEVMSCPENINRFDIMCKEGYRRVQSLSYVLPWNELEDEFNKLYIPNPFKDGSSKKKSPNRIELNTPPMPTTISSATRRVFDATRRAAETGATNPWSQAAADVLWTTEGPRRTARIEPTPFDEF